MKDFLLLTQWGWRASGVLLGLTLVFAVFLIKPIGVSTQYTLLDSVIRSGIESWSSPQNKDLNGAYSDQDSPLYDRFNTSIKKRFQHSSYGLVFVASMVFGGFVASRVNKKNSPKALAKTGFTSAKKVRPKRYLFSFIGGFLVLFGARLAGGCTSGHMMSGMMQTALSGYLFAIAAFVTAIPVAMLIYSKLSKIDMETMT